MAYLRLLIEYGAYPLWIYAEDGGVIDTALLKEWEDDTELENMLDRIQSEYDALFINNEREFSYKGFKSRDAQNDFVDLVKRAVQRVTERNNGKYILYNDIDEAFLASLYTGDK